MSYSAQMWIDPIDKCFLLNTILLIWNIKKSLKQHLIQIFMSTLEKTLKKDNIFNTHPSIVQFLHSVLYEKISDQIHQENGPMLHFDMIDTILKILFYPVSMMNKS